LRIASWIALARFVETARGAGVEIVVVEGDPGMALEEGRRIALNRQAAILAYERGAEPTQRLAGLQYDIEPYLLPDYAGDPAAVQLGWAETIKALHRAGPGLTLDIVLPFWLADDENAVATVLSAVARAAGRITVMAYRTDGAAIQAAAEPLLAWSDREGVPVHVALEAGPLEDEVARFYSRAPKGELWVAPQAGGGMLALQLDEPRADPRALVYGLSYEIATPAHRVSFLGDEKRLMREADAVAAAFQAWPSFGGIAYHGAIE